MRKLFCFALLAVGLIAGCNGGAALSVVLSLLTAQALDNGQTISITATVMHDNGKGVMWSLTGPGALSSQTTTSVTYTAPASGTGSATITATSVADSTKTSTLMVTVTAPPSITTTSLANGIVGTAYNQPVAASGGAGTLTFSLATGTLPNGLTLSNAGAITGTPTAVGKSTFTVKVTDSSTVSPQSATSGTLTITVNQAPAITSANSVTFVVSTAGTFTVTATGTPTPNLGESGALPNGVTFVDNGNGTGTLSGTPASGTAKNYAITFTASNGVGTAATQNFTLTVGQSPAITSTGATTFTVGTAGNFTVTTTGFPPPALTETGATLPNGVTFVDNGNGTATLSGNAAAGTGGTYSFTIKAHNGIGADATQSFQLTVDETPAITSANKTTFIVGTAGMFTVTASGFPKPSLKETGTLPGGVTFVDNGNGTGTLAGIPSTTGNFPITFTPSNGVGSPAAQNFTLTVGQAPAFTSGTSVTFTVGAAGTFSVTTSGFPAPALTEAGTLPGGVTFTDNGNGTGTLAGTPAGGTGGTYAIKFTATNGVGSPASQNFTLTVDEAPHITSANAATFTVNAAGTFTVTTTGFPAPALTEAGTLPGGVTFTDNGNGTGTLKGTPTAAGSFAIMFTASNGISPNATQNFTLTVDQAPAITSANNVTFTALTPGTFTVTATGVPTPTLSEAGTLPNGVTFNSSTGVLSGTPAAGTGGVYPITFTAMNGVGANFVQNFTLTVDQAPGFTSATSTTFTVGAAGTFTVTATGPPNPAITESGTLPGGVTFTDNGNGTGTLKGTPSAAGSFPIMFTAANGIAPNATQNFTLTVDTAPVITSATSTTFIVGTAGTFTVMASGTPAPTLTESGALPMGVTFTPATGVLGGTPATGTGGTYPIKFTAHNGIGADSVQNFTLTVDEAPKITSASSTTFTVGAAGSFNVTATGTPAPTFSETGGLPMGVSLSPSGLLSGTPAANTGGTYMITITAANGIAPTSTQNFTLNVNTGAVITSANATTFTVGTAGTFTVTATGTPTPTLSESGTLPGGVTFTPATGVLSGTPTTGTGGTYPITFTAHNGIGADFVQNFTLTVDEAPKITSAASTTFIVNTSSSFMVTATGFPAPTISESGALPTGVTFLNGVLSGTPTATGTFAIMFTAANGVGTNFVQNFMLTVTTGPAMVSTSVGTFGVPFFAGNPATTINITVTNDAPGDVVTASLTVDGFSTFNCTTATCGTLNGGTLGPVTAVGTSGSGSYTVSYTPPPSLPSFLQTSPALVVNSSLPNSVGSTDFMAVVPAGIFVQVFAPNRGGEVYVGVNPVDTRNLTVNIFNDTTQKGVTFAPLTADGYACATLNPNSCGTLGTPTVPAYSTDTSTGINVSVGTLTIPYTAPMAVPAAPYNTPAVKAISVADNTRSGKAQFLIANTPTPPTLPPMWIFKNTKFNTILIGSGATLMARILNDTGVLKTVNWTLTSGGVSCSPAACGTLTVSPPTVTGTTVDSSVLYTPPASATGAAATATITAASADTPPGGSDSFTFNILDPTCGSGNEKVLNGQYAFLLRGGGAGAGHIAFIGSFTADGAGHITGGLYDAHASNGSAFLNLTLLTVAQGQLPASSYSVGSDNRGCLTLADNTGGLETFRFAVGTPTTVGGVSVATQGRILSFDSVALVNRAFSGVMYRQDPTSFNAGAFSGTYVDGFVGVDPNGGRFSSAGLLTSNGSTTLSNISTDFDDAGTIGNLTGGSGTYSMATNAPGGRGTATVTITGAGTSNLVIYMVSSSRILGMTTDLVSTGRPLESGEIRKQTGPFTQTMLDGKDYVFYVEGVHPSDGGNDTVLGQTTFTTNGSATITLDENKSGVEQAEQVAPAALFTITSNGRTTISGVPGGGSTPILYLIDSTSAFIVGTSNGGESGFVEQQVGGPFNNNASLNGAFFFAGDAPTTSHAYQSGTVTLDGNGNVNGTGDRMGPNGLGIDTISPSNGGGTYCITSSCSPPISTPVGRGIVGVSQGHPSIAYVISSSTSPSKGKLIFMSTGSDPGIFIVQQ